MRAGAPLPAVCAWSEISTAGPQACTRSASRTESAGSGGEPSMAESAPRAQFVTSCSSPGHAASELHPTLGCASATQWLAGPVVDLRATTQACYRNAIDQHLMRRFATHRLDAISPDDVAVLVRELRADGLAESTIVIVVGVRIYRYAARRLGWAGTNPSRFCFRPSGRGPARARSAACSRGPSASRRSPRPASITARSSRRRR